MFFNLLILARGYVYWFYRGRQREKNIDVRNISGLPPIHTPTRDETHSLGMCPDQESNLQPSGVRDGAPTKWATRQGKTLSLIKQEA